MCVTCPRLRMSRARVPRKLPVMGFSSVTMRRSSDGVTCCSSYPGGSFLTHCHRGPHGRPTRPLGVDRC